MSVLIKGMEMPKSCWECTLSYEELIPADWSVCLRCAIDNSQVLAHRDDKAYDCPLVEVWALPFDKKNELDTLERIRSGKGLLPIVNVSDCPLEEVSTPHGALIDRDKWIDEMWEKLLPELTKKYGETDALKGLHFSFLDCIENVNNADVIIAAGMIHDGGRS